MWYEYTRCRNYECTRVSSRGSPLSPSPNDRAHADQSSPLRKSPLWQCAHCEQRNLCVRWRSSLERAPIDFSASVGPRARPSFTLSTLRAQPFGACMPMGDSPPHAHTRDFRPSRAAGGRRRATAVQSRSAATRCNVIRRCGGDGDGDGDVDDEAQAIASRPLFARTVRLQRGRRGWSIEARRGAVRRDVARRDVVNRVTEDSERSNLPHGPSRCVKLERDIKMGTTNAQTDSGHAHDETHSRGNSIDAFFAETVILLTGATGFLGKALLEKLLRSCPRVATIFVLIRPKKDQSVEQRYKELLNNPVFDRIRSEFPGTLNKIFPVKGDVGLPELGLQPEDRDMLLQRVNIVFHSAATVRFNESLKIAVNLNTMGTDRMLDLCKRMTNLISVIHVSTAYSNADRREIDESIYITEVKPYTVIDICENLDDETIRIIEKRLIGKHPNTYTLTKGLAEQIILSKGSSLPIAIVRPSIVCAAYQEPFPGWIDNICGITGIMTEIGRGTVRSIVCNANLIVDVVPVDFVVNTLICASWHNAVQHTDTIKIYNCTSSAVHPITWREFGYLTRKHALESPSKYVMWYPDFTFRTNKFIHAIIVATLHFLPAFIVDLILRVQGCKPIMMKITKRFERAAKTGEFFAMNEWKFYMGNMTKLIKFVEESEDCSNFDVDIRNLDWDVYLHQYMLGIRKYILKDNPDTLNNARSRLSRLYWMHKFTKVLSIFVLLGMIKCAGR